MRIEARGMSDRFRLNALSGPAQWLVLGRGVGFLATFLVPLVLVRVFDQATFGTYKQLFLIYATLYGLAQVGVAESLYYFVPRHPADAGRHAVNAVGTLAVMGLASAALITLAAPHVATWLRNPELAETLWLLGAFLALMLTSAAFEIVLVARTHYKAAAWTYAASDVARATLVLFPAMALWGLRGVLWGAITFAALRVVAMLWAFSRTIRVSLRPSLELWRSQWIYTLPFALAVTVEALQANVHHYVVASQFDPATFAIYAVGCLQIPLVDVLTTSSANVMMVKMGEEGFDRRGAGALALWHDTTRRLALVVFPLVAFLLVVAHDLIAVLFTSQYLASVPIFMLWTAALVFAVPCVDAVLRAYAQTRVLFGLNVLRLVIVLALIPWFLSAFGLPGAVLVTLLSTAVVRAAGVARIAWLMGAGIRSALPWRQLAATAACAAVAAAPALWFARSASMSRPVLLVGAFAIYASAYAVLCSRLGSESAGAPPVPALQNVL
jgi:O-antigen/teichoic acid export membrane protein